MNLKQEIVEILRTAKEIGYQGSAKYIWLACADCGKERWVQLRLGKPAFTFCNSCKSKGERSSYWKGGKWINSDGYVLVLLQPLDFFYPMANRNRYVLEHRLIVAKALNRCLLPWEVVHHKSGAPKDDNRYPETLELITDRRFHLVDTVIKSYIARLEKRIRLLEWQVKELNIKLRGNNERVKERNS